jgi:signal transduction histidine kinase
MARQNVDLNQVLTDLTPMLDVLTDEDVELSIETEPALWPALTDRRQCEQVILNLAMNARDAMPGGGRLTIGTANVDLDDDYARAHFEATSGPHVRLIVADTGVGMSREVLSHAFEPFFTTKARGKGTGLGLSTVIGVVQQSGGFLDVRSPTSTCSSPTWSCRAWAGAVGAAGGDAPGPADPVRLRLLGGNRPAGPGQRRLEVPAQAFHGRGFAGAHPGDPGQRALTLAGPRESRPGAGLGQGVTRFQPG